jgi:hypothetical protein
MRWLALPLFGLLMAEGCTKRLVLFTDGGGSIDDEDGGGTGGAGTGGAGTGGAGTGSGGTGSGGTGSGGWQNGACSSRMRIQIAPRAGVAVMMVVGRNASMGTQFGGGTTRMRAVQDQVADAVTTRGRAVSFGYLDMPAMAPDPSCTPSSAGCCANLGYTPPAPFNRDSIVERQSRCEGGGNTPGCVSSSSARPIADGLQRASDAYTFAAEPGDVRYVLLIVDGGPSCPGADPNRLCYDAASEVFQLKMGPRVKTYVLAVGEDAVNDPCLSELATAGDTVSPFPARDADELERSFSGLLDKVTANSCKLDLLTIPRNPNAVSLEVNGRLVRADGSGRNGWRFAPAPPGAPPSRIEVFGDACLELQNADNQDIQVWECTGRT